MLFSRRVPSDLSENPVARALRERRGPFVDLTVSNPTAVGLSPSDDEVRDAIAAPGSATYRPEPRGLRSAREAIARRYADGGIDVDPERIFLTASTSEAYAFIFKLLGEPGDAALVPEPSYPLFDHLLRFEGLTAVPYRLRRSPPDERWRADFGSLERGLDSGARIVLSVHPNNPTGNFVARDERRRLLAMLDRDRHALVSDEVFLDYPVEGSPDPAGVAASESGGPLAFSLGGLSKSCALPQLKLAWIVVGGEPAAVRDAGERLELIADTFLSVSTPVQLALPRLFEIGAPAAARVAERLRRNLAALDAALGKVPGAVRFPVEGGWSAVVELPPRHGAASDPAVDLLAGGVLVQPGWFFDFASENAVVLSLLPAPDDFDEGLDRIVAAAAPAG